MSHEFRCSHKFKHKLWTRTYRFLWQKLTRGWDDSETWSLDYSLAKLILSRLKRYKEISITYPLELTVEQWDSYLDEMIFAFEWFGSEERWDNGPDCHSKFERAQKGIDLFAKYYSDLWW